MIEITNNSRLAKAEKFLAMAERMKSKSRAKFWALKALAELNMIGDLSFDIGSTAIEARKIVNR